MSSLVKVLNVLVLCIFTKTVCGYPTGAPIYACLSFKPLHGSSDAQLDYQIETNQVEFSPGNAVSITLNPGNETSFKGILMQVITEIEEKVTPVGSFNTVPTNFKKLNCLGITKSSVTHSNRLNKASTTFTWTAPDSCTNSSVFTIRATVVKDFSTYQFGLEKELICYSNTN